MTINVIAKPIEVNADSTRNIVNEKREKVGRELNRGANDSINIMDEDIEEDLNTRLDITRKDELWENFDISQDDARRNQQNRVVNFPSLKSLCEETILKLNCHDILQAFATLGSQYIFSPAFEEVAFKTPVGKMSQLIESG